MCRPVHSAREVDRLNEPLGGDVPMLAVVCVMGPELFRGLPRLTWLAGTLTWLRLSGQHEGVNRWHGRNCFQPRFASKDTKYGDEGAQ